MSNQPDSPKVGEALAAQKRLIDAISKLNQTGLVPVKVSLGLVAEVTEEIHLCLREDFFTQSELIDLLKKEFPFLLGKLKQSWVISIPRNGTLSHDKLVVDGYEEILRLLGASDKQQDFDEEDELSDPRYQRPAALQEFVRELNKHVSMECDPFASRVQKKISALGFISPRTPLALVLQLKEDLDEWIREGQWTEDDIGLFLTTEHPAFIDRLKSSQTCERSLWIPGRGEEPEDSKVLRVFADILEMLDPTQTDQMDSSTRLASRTDAIQLAHQLADRGKGPIETQAEAARRAVSSLAELLNNFDIGRAHQLRGPANVIRKAWDDGEFMPSADLSRINEIEKLLKEHSLESNVIGNTYTVLLPIFQEIKKTQQPLAVQSRTPARPPRTARELGNTFVANLLKTLLSWWEGK